MKWHVLRPLWLALAVIAAILVARSFLVPDDFGIHGENFTYGYYRLSNIDDWKAFPVKYQGREYCIDCHRDKLRTLNRSPHRRIECESCHGPAAGHPDPVEFLPKDRSREHCLRCHADLGYPDTARDQVPSISDRRHYRRRECADCHNPHNPKEDAS